MPSSDSTPLYGPQLPRIRRRRENSWYSLKNNLTSYSRNGITFIENPPVVTTVRVPYPNVDNCLDTIRNPAYYTMLKNIPAKDRPVISDDGGRFICTKSFWEFSDQGRGQTSPWIGNTRYKYGLTVLLGNYYDNGFYVYSSYPPAEDYDLTPWHAKAYRALRPDRPFIDLLTFVAELRDLVHLNFKAIRDIKSISDWWLAVNFGWKPLLEDIRRMVKLYQAFDERLQWIIKNESIPVRRRAILFEEADPVVIITNTTNLGINRNTCVDYGKTQLTSAWKHRLTRSRTRKVWASGSFIFYIKDLQLPEKRMYVKAALAGLQPSPSQIWNALPWSWLVDWVSNVGDILDNMSKQVSDRLVAKYCYVMSETTRTYDWMGTDGYFTCTAKHSFVSKSREVVHPYGLSFGSALTTRQMSILAALAAQRF